MVLSSVLKVMFLGIVAVPLLVWLYLKFGPSQRIGLTPARIERDLVRRGAAELVRFAFDEVLEGVVRIEVRFELGVEGQ